jgi:hypothetical protein
MIMKKYSYFLLCILGIGIPKLHAQIVSVSPGSSFNIKAGTVISAGGLDLIPATDFSFTSSLTRSTIVSNPTSATTINRSYQFGTTTDSYSGVISLNYDDSELNGLTESSLQLFYNNGIQWLTDTNTSNNTSANYATSLLTATALNEISLTSQDLSNPNFEGNAVRFLLYPNPTRNILTIEASNNATIDKIIVIDMLGKIVLEELPENNHINVERFASGTYILKAFSGATTFITKFIKLN